MRTTRPGVALIEVILSTAILVTFAIPLYAFIGENSQSTIISSQTNFARVSLENKLEEIRSLPEAQIVDSDTQAPVSDLPGGVIRTVITETDQVNPSLKKTTVTITWNAPGRQKTIQAATLINIGSTQ